MPSHTPTLAREWFELEPRTVHDTRDDFTHVKRDAQVLGDDAEQFFGIMDGSSGGLVGLVHAPPVEMLDYLTTTADPIVFVFRQVVRQTGYRSVHLRAAERLFFRVLARSHLDEWRAGKKHLGLLG